MVSNLKELIRWLTFIPVPLIFGPLVGALILIPIFFIFPNSLETGPDIPTKLILTSIMWIVIFWFGAFLKPNNLPMNAFRIIWILLTTLCIFRFLIQNSSFDWRYQLLEIIIPIYFFPYSGNYPNRAMFMTSVNLRYKKMLGFIPKEEQLIGLFGWSPPTVIFAVSLFLETLFLTFNGSPFALLSFFGATSLYSSISTTVFSKDPNFKKNPLPKYLTGLGFLIAGVFLVRVSGVNSISFLNFPLNLYILPCVLGLTYFPGNYPKDFEWN